MSSFIIQQRSAPIPKRSCVGQLLTSFGTFVYFYSSIEFIPRKQDTLFETQSLHIEANIFYILCLKEISF